jgi:hypothetical protein
MVETIRTATAADIDTIKRIAIDTDMFGPDDVGFFDEMITGFLDGTMDDNHWLTVEHDYDEEARICEFYGTDDHEVVFWKSLLPDRA